MEFWKTHAKLRMLLIAVFFAAGVGITIFGWSMTGKMAGLGIMVVGVICLLAALWMYNKPFQSKKIKKLKNAAAVQTAKVQGEII